MAAAARQRCLPLPLGSFRRHAVMRPAVRLVDPAPARRLHRARVVVLVGQLELFACVPLAALGSASAPPAVFPARPVPSPLPVAPPPLPPPGRALYVVPSLPTRGGPDPAAPCRGCALRATCADPCALLAALLSPPELRAREEVSSPALMAGRGRDEAFQALPPHLPRPATRVTPRLLPAHGPALAAALATLRPGTRALLLRHAAGAPGASLAREVGCTRQAMHRRLALAMRRVRERLGREGGMRPGSAAREWRDLDDAAQ